MDSDVRLPQRPPEKHESDDADFCLRYSCQAVPVEADCASISLAAGHKKCLHGSAGSCICSMKLVLWL